MTSFNRVAMLALGLLSIASTAPALAQPNGDRASAGRAAAIRECDRAAARYPSTYGATLTSKCIAPAWPSAASRSDAPYMAVRARDRRFREKIP
jgi:hypothetical protein